MEAWMVVTALIVVLLPLVLMAVFQWSNTADARGQRVDQRWRVRGKKT